MKSFGVGIILFILLSISLTAQNFSDGFNFLMPADDSTSQLFLPVFEKQPITDFVGVSPQGDFLVADQPVKFWGVNFVTGACFPDHSDANKLVGRMRKMGINLVRFHHMDNSWTTENGTIFNHGNTLTINPFNLDKFHHLLSKMKEEGIYANVNLLVSRQFSEADGLAHFDTLYETQKVISMFDGELIQLQKNYAAQLLQANNFYTNLSLADDPVLAMVEINNENSIYGYWKQDYLQAIYDGGELLWRHADTLNRKWNEFLTEKYVTHEALAAAWSSQSTYGDELILNGNFESNDIHQDWYVELHNNAAATVSITTDNPFEGNQCALVNVTQPTGTGWHVQLKQTGFNIQKDSAYIAYFAARADEPTAFWVGVSNNGPPYNSYGGKWVEVGTDWLEYWFFYTPDEDNPDNSRFGFSLGEQSGTIYLDNVSTYRLKKVDLEDGEHLDLANIKRMTYSDRYSYADQRVNDLAEFYIQLQTDYYTEMADFLRNEVGVQVPITGTNALGGLYEIKSAENLDYIDDHAYWDHPSFPNGWSSTNWTIHNRSMVEDDYLGTITELFGGLPKANQPFTVSEYNHPSPNIYQAEMIPILAAYGSFHGADGLMFYEYNSGDPADWWQNKVEGFFPVWANPALMAQFPMFAKAYRDGLIQEDDAPILATYTEDYLYAMPQHDDYARWGKYFPYDESIALTKSVRTAGFDGGSVQLPPDMTQTNPYHTSTQEITFDRELDLVHVHAPKLESITGRLGQAPQLPSGKMAVSGDDFGVVSWMSLSEKDLESTDLSLLTVVSRFQNQGMVWEGTNTVHDNWGLAPTELKPLSVDIQFNLSADSIRLYPLNGKGEILDSLTIFPQGGLFLFHIDQSGYQTPWFGVRSFHQPLVITEPHQHGISIFPNPVAPNGVLQVRGLKDTPYRILNAIGQVTRSGRSDGHIILDDLPEGIYHLIFELNKEIVCKKIVVE